MKPSRLDSAPGGPTDAGLHRRIVRKIVTVMATYQLAQLNIGIIRAPMDSPVMAEFANNLERINALADHADGFVWRLQSEAGDATAIRPFEDPNQLLNMSVWGDLASLNAFVYRSAHTEIMRRRREWFEPISRAFVVLWWVPRGHRPSVAEAVERLEWLRSRGPTAEAFTFRQPFPPPDATGEASSIGVGDICPAT
jgi:hypothetical protein